MPSAQDRYLDLDLEDLVARRVALQNLAGGEIEVLAALSGHGDRQAVEIGERADTEALVDAALLGALLPPDVLRHGVGRESGLRTDRQIGVETGTDAAR